MDFDAHTDPGPADDLGAPDPLAAPDGATTLGVTVDGELHSYAATLDLDGDGVADTVHVDTDDGGYDYTDTDGDGVADTLTEYDLDGEVTAQATYDVAEGGWREVVPGTSGVDGVDRDENDGPDGSDGDRDGMRADPAAQPTTRGVDTAPDATGAPTTGGIVVDTPDGPASAGVASYDTTGDGRPDTAVATTTEGSTVVVTDVDGDGTADYVTEVGRDGTFTSFEHTGEAEWTVVDRGTLGGGPGAAGDPEPAAPVPAAPSEPRPGGATG